LNREDIEEPDSSVFALFVTSAKSGPLDLAWRLIKNVGKTVRRMVTQGKRKAVVLVSGGVDSATTLALAKKERFDLHALSFDYGQRHRCELEAAKRVTAAIGVTRHVVVELNLRAIGGSALTSDLEVPKGRAVAVMGAEIPVTYVPARNTVFLAVALGWCEALGASDMFIGANAVDYSGYPDCRPAFLEAFQNLAQLATRAGVEGRSRFHVHAPLLHMSKAQIIRAGVSAGVDFGLTHSCYDPSPGGLACGTCDSCIIRAKGFLDAGVPDPTRYALK
jgi:7-cyano-7-deazaguanine synthase